MRKLRLGFLSFTCDEGCAMVFLEALNTRYKSWTARAEFRSKLLRGRSKLKGLDVAFVEGAISTADEVRKIRRVRANCKVLVAIGACAIDATPAAHRNFFAKRELAEIAPTLKKFGYLAKVKPLSAFVKVDHEVPGCPMDEAKFVALVEQLLKGV